VCCSVLTPALCVVLFSLLHCVLFCPDSRTVCCSVLTPALCVVLSWLPHCVLFCPHSRTVCCLDAFSDDADHKQKLDGLIRLAELCIEILQQNDEYHCDVCTHIYTYIHIYTHIYTYIHIILCYTKNWRKTKIL